MGHDYKDEFKLESARNFLTGSKKMYTHNEEKSYDVNTFSEWIKLEYKRVCESEISLRNAKNDLLNIIEKKDIKIDEMQCKIDGFRQMLNTLGEHGIYSEEGLAEYFKSRNEEIDRLKSIASGQPTQAILNLQERLQKLDTLIEELRMSNCCIFSSVAKVWNIEYMDLESMIFTVISTGENFMETLERASAKDWKPIFSDEKKNYTSIMTELEDINKLFEQQVSDLTAEKLSLQIENASLQELKTMLEEKNEELKNENKQLTERYIADGNRIGFLEKQNKELQNINEGLHLLINKQDDAEKDLQEIAKCQAVVDAANELREYLENK